MPGIAGVIASNPAADLSRELQQMRESLQYEPDYQFGEWHSPECQLWITWTTFRGHSHCLQPLFNNDGSIGLVSSGDLYSDRSLVRAPANSCRHEDEWQRLLQSYAKDGICSLRSLNGWFSGVIIDVRKKCLFLFCDRFGLNRIYYHEWEHGFAFSSDAKAILRVRSPTRAFRNESLAEYLACGCPLQGRSLFRGISILPPASSWRFSPNQPAAKNSFFEASEWTNLSPLAPAEFYTYLHDSFPRILSRYAADKGTIGLSLTGGVDSRMVLAWLSHRPPGSLPCYTFVGPYRNCADVTIAARLARECHQPHTSIYVGSDFLNAFPVLAARSVYITDGAMGAIGAADLYVNRLASAIAPVRLTGNYGGEILRSLVAFKPTLNPPSFLHADLHPHYQTAVRTYFAELSYPRLSFIVNKQVPWHHFSRLSLERSQLTLRTPYLDNDLVALAFRAPSSVATSNVPSLRLVHDGNPSLARFSTDRGDRYAKRSLFAAAGHAYHEFMFRAEYAFDYGMPHSLAVIDHVLSPLRLERLFLGRHKFLHFRLWYKRELSQYIRSVLLDPVTLRLSYIDRRKLESIVLRHTRGVGNFTSEIHAALSLALIEAHLLNPNPPSRT